MISNSRKFVSSLLLEKQRTQLSFSELNANFLEIG
jgi:hypothetical protein